jgi:hypothetical protein
MILNRAAGISLQLQGVEARRGLSVRDVRSPVVTLEEKHTDGVD